MAKDRSVNDSSGSSGDNFTRQLGSDMAKSDAEQLKSDITNADTEQPEQSKSVADEPQQQPETEDFGKYLGDIADEKLHILALKSINNSKYKVKPRQKKPMALRTRLFVFAIMLVFIMVSWLILSKIFPITLSDSETSLTPVLVQYMPFIAIGMAALLSFGTMLCESKNSTAPKIIYFIIMIVAVIFIIITLKYIMTSFTSVIDIP